MFDARFPLAVAKGLLTAARTLDATLASGSVENARGALVAGRREQVIRSILEDLEQTSGGELVPVASDAG